MVSSYSIVVVLHILAVIVAAGAVTVTDYLHLVGLRKKKLEKQLNRIYPKLSDLISFSLIIIILTGGYLVYLNPSLLSNPLFLIKVSLVFLVSINGIFLQRKVSPSLDLCVIKGRKYCSQSVLYSSAISGSFSIVTWYSIIIISLTKTYGYNAVQFISAYLIILFVAILLALYFERRARKWNDI